jgi:kinesin family protein 3/17
LEKKDETAENVRVVVRCRPLESSAKRIVKVDKTAKSITVYKPNATGNEPPKVYFFDNVFGEDSAQVLIFLP